MLTTARARMLGKINRPPCPGGNRKPLGRRDVSDEERIELESDPSPDEDDVNQGGAEHAETAEEATDASGLLSR